jgi:hypothetical protein
LQITKSNDNFNITYQFINGDNNGSVFSNKEFQVCYTVVDIDIVKTKMKKIIGCFINPNDLYLDKAEIDKHIYYFQIYLKLDKIFTVSEMLKNTIYSKNYSNHITKKIFFENNKDVTIKKIISKCESLLKEKVLIR